MAMTMQQFAADRQSEFQRSVTAAIKTLIQEKHLYQSVSVPPTDSYTSLNADTSHGKAAIGYAGYERWLGH